MAQVKKILANIRPGRKGDLAARGARPAQVAEVLAEARLKLTTNKQRVAFDRAVKKTTLAGATKTRISDLVTKGEITGVEATSIFNKQKTLTEVLAAKKR